MTEKRSRLEAETLQLNTSVTVVFHKTLEEESSHRSVHAASSHIWARLHSFVSVTLCKGPIRRGGHTWRRRGDGRRRRWSEQERLQWWRPWWWWCCWRLEIKTLPPSETGSPDRCSVWWRPSHPLWCLTGCCWCCWCCCWCCWWWSCSEPSTQPPGTRSRPAYTWLDRQNHPEQTGRRIQSKTTCMITVNELYNRTLSTVNAFLAWR